MAVVQILVFAFLTLLAHNVQAVCVSGSWGLGKRAADAGGLHSNNGNFCCKTNCTSYYCPNQQLCSTSDWCKNSDFYYWDGALGGGWYSDCDGCSQQQQEAACLSGVSLGASGTIVLTCHKRCSTECEAKENTCAQDTSKVWDPETCTCSPKPAPPQTCSYCEDYTTQTFPPVQKSRTFECTQCVEDSTGQVWYNPSTCNKVRDSEGTCQDNNDCPNGMVCNDSTPTVDCYMTVGSTVYLRDRRNNHVWGCEADGDCQYALRKYAAGECQDPHPTPNSSSSDSEPNSSSDSEPNSSSSESGGSSAVANGPWALETTLKENTGYVKKTAENTGDIANYTVTIMGKTSDIYNELVEHGITLNNIKDNTDDIKTNTGNTATNTNNIDNKLANTNSLLTDIKNKNWQPHIEVNPPEVTVQGDTNIVNVTTDTAKSGAAILDYLKGIFGNMDTTSNYNPNDTVGSGASIDSVMGRIGELVSDSSYLAVGDSVGQAVLGMKSSYNALKDTLGHSAINDSLNRWGQALTNNGVITGNGSDNCPSILERDWELNFGLGVTITAGHLGRYMCTPIGGLSITIWALCRVLLRAIVAIGCMLWLYKAVLGIDGGSNDED